MKILQYNILDGCKETSRYKKLTAWIENQAFDIISFNELNGWKNEEFYKEMRKIGYPYSYLFEAKSSPYFEGIAAKSPIKVIRSVEEDPIYHSLIHVEISGIEFVIVHLTPFESFKREKETEFIVNLAKERVAPLIVMGDFNTLSPTDKDYYRISETAEKLSKKPILATQHLLSKGEINYLPMEILLQAGLQDILQHKSFEGTMPTKMKPQSADVIDLRVDYMLGNRKLLDMNPQASAIKTAETDQISDHYPIQCEIEI